MTDPKIENEDAVEAEAMGEKPDLGHKSDALRQSLTGTDSGSDTRAGSLEGGAASGSDADDAPDTDAINKAMADKGRELGAPKTPNGVEPHPVKNTGEDDNGPDAAPPQSDSPTG